MSKDRSRIITSFADALRPLTPNGVQMTDAEVVSQWQYGGLSHEEEEYGDAKCTCGHDIKFVFYVELKNGGGVYEPVGKVCVEEVFGHGADIHEAIELEKCLRKIKEVFDILYELDGGVELDERLVSSENGFTRKSMSWLCERLETKKGVYLWEIFKSRKYRTKTTNQMRFLRVIAEDIYRILNKSYKIK